MKHSRLYVNPTEAVAQIESMATLTLFDATTN